MMLDRKLPMRFVTAAAVACLSAGVSAGGGRGGDSSMNPFTGDSYAYFNGGHNLGEQAMIIPWRSRPQDAPKEKVDATRDTRQSASPRRQNFYQPPRDSTPQRQ
ncbi:MAG TPA: hypothetical protein VGK44_03575 [Casimicrobiaceae bacterium]|jgi:hypothetical protein